jgi:hypothetical protein
LKASIRRHRVAHLPEKLAKAQEAKEVAEADTLLGEVREAKRRQRLYSAAEEILKGALQAKDLRTAIQAIRAAADVMGEARAHLQLEGEITGELNPASPGGARTVLVVLPALVPSGTRDCPLNMQIPDEAIEKDLAEGRGPVIDVPVAEGAPQSRKLLSPGGEDERDEVA